MVTNIYINALNQFSAVLLSVLSMTLIKSILLFAIVALLIRAFSVTSVRTKYVLWVFYVFSVILITIYTAASPAFRIPFLQIFPHMVRENKILSNLLFPQWRRRRILHRISGCDDAQSRKPGRGAGADRRSAIAQGITHRARLPTEA